MSEFLAKGAEDDTFNIDSMNFFRPLYVAETLVFKAFGTTSTGSF
jgi:hypothetical protein